jgi:adenylate cyclase
VAELSCGAARYTAARKCALDSLERRGWRTQDAGERRMRWAAKRRLRVLAAMSAIAALGGAAYGAMAAPHGPDGPLRGIVTGIAIAVPLTLLELYVIDSRLGEGVRRLSLGWALVVKTLVYLAAILIGLEIGRRVVPIAGPPSPAGDVAWDALFSLGFAALVNFVMQIRRVLGHGVLGKFILGRYHRPREEARVFLFLDLAGSTALAERIGGPRFLDLLNRLYMHVTEPIAEHGGEIHKYVGDEVIVTWAGERGFADANCVRCVFAIEDQIEALAGSYRRRFGHVPRFRGGIHFGPVVTGEIGDIKQEIAFLGDGMNTTARLIDVCREHDRACVVSAAALDRLRLPDGILAEPLGAMRLRGKSEALPVFALSRAAAGSDRDAPATSAAATRP